jgi:transmembrane sensor
VRPTEDSRSRRERSAAAWFARSLAGDMNASERARYDRWYADPVNAREYRLLERLWLEAPAYLSDAALEPPAPQVRQRRPALAGVFAAAAAIVGLVVVTGVALSVLRPAAEPLAFTSGAAEHRKLVLDDASRVDLNARTEIQVRFDPAERRVALRSGEAYFTVSKNVRRPFIVQTSLGAVTAVGTQFDVRTRGPDTMSVDVIEGAVDVRATRSGQTRRLTAGARAVITAAGIEILPASVARVGGWRAGRLVFDATPLSEVVEELNAVSPTPIVLADASLARRHVTGNFAMNRRDAVLRALEVTLGLKAVRERNGVVRLRRASQP